MPFFQPPELRHAFDLTVELDPIREMGRGRAGRRRIIPIVGGTCEGPRIKGRVLNLGADWQTIWDSGVSELDTRYGIETHDGATIEIFEGFSNTRCRVLGCVHGPQVGIEGFHFDLKFLQAVGT